MSWVIVEWEGRRQRVPVVRTAGGAWVGWPGGAALFKSREQRADDALAAGAVVAPMTGKVVQVRVKPGDAVKADDVLLVLEAMKMEYRLGAPRDGVVEAVRCEEGELVDLGASLITLAS